VVAPEPKPKRNPDYLEKVNLAGGKRRAWTEASAKAGTANLMETAPTNTLHLHRCSTPWVRAETLDARRQGIEYLDKDLPGRPKIKAFLHSLSLVG
jgi:hypothetical protein